MKSGLLDRINDSYKQSKLYPNGWRRTIVGTALAGIIGLSGTSGATGVLFGNGETFGQKAVDAAEGVVNPTVLWEYRYAYQHRQEIQKSAKKIEALLPDIERVASSTEQSNRALQATEKGLQTFDNTVRYAEKVTRNSQQALHSLKDVSGRVERMGYHLAQARENLSTLHPINAATNLQELYWEYQSAKEPIATAYEQTTTAANNVLPDAQKARTNLETTVRNIRELRDSTNHMRTYLERAQATITELKQTEAYKVYERAQDNLAPDELPATIGTGGFVQLLALYGAWQVRRHALRGQSGIIDKWLKQRALKKWSVYYMHHPEDIAGKKGLELYQASEVIKEDNKQSK
ncbi:MAG: hypothetical protein WC595_04810 [Candidatus Nanoarchaeia archaeon]